MSFSSKGLYKSIPPSLIPTGDQRVQYKRKTRCAASLPCVTVSTDCSPGAHQKIIGSSFVNDDSDSDERTTRCVDSLEENHSIIQEVKDKRSYRKHVPPTPRTWDIVDKANRLEIAPRDNDSGRILSHLCKINMERCDEDLNEEDEDHSDLYSHRDEETENNKVDNEKDRYAVISQPEEEKKKRKSTKSETGENPESRNYYNNNLNENKIFDMTNQSQDRRKKEKDVPISLGSYIFGLFLSFFRIGLSLGALFGIFWILNVLEEERSSSSKVDEIQSQTFRDFSFKNK